MRTTFAGLILAVFFSTPVHAIGDLTALFNVQQECAQVGKVSFGDKQRWVACQVTRGRWVATIDLVDMYQAQYCLGDGAGICQQRALQLFANRAYTPTAKLLIQRIDPAATEYDDPLVVKNDYGRILTISARLPDGTRSNQYYLWQAGGWVPVDSRKWLKDLARQLPHGITAEKISLPDVDTMSATAELYRKDAPDCCANGELAKLDLGLDKKRFVLKKIAVSKLLP